MKYEFEEWAFDIELMTCLVLRPRSIDWGRDREMVSL
jgi:hypothetical protein